MECDTKQTRSTFVAHETVGAFGNSWEPLTNVSHVKYFDVSSVLQREVLHHRDYIDQV